jgi:hypothetical protein
MKRPRLCDGCRALHGISLDQYCALGYSFDLIVKQRKWGATNTAKPAEPCPKPRTWQDFFDAKHKDHPQRSLTPVAADAGTRG